jgi:N utilization substance protein B
MNQHESRKLAMQAVYAANQDRDLSAAEIESNLVASLQLKSLSAYSKTLIEGVLSHRSELEQDIAAHLKAGWRLERVNQISVAILEVALFELKYSSEIEPKSAVNEALNLCDEFADPKNKPFINGLLANFVK